MAMLGDKTSRPSRRDCRPHASGSWQKSKHTVNQFAPPRAISVPLPDQLQAVVKGLCELVQEYFSLLRSIPAPVPTDVHDGPVSGDGINPELIPRSMQANVD